MPIFSYIGRMAMNRKKLSNQQGFTMVELVMVILLVAILAAVAIPQFIDFGKDARDAATEGGLGAMRAAVSIGASAISVKEAPLTSPATYPTLAELQANKYLAASPNNHAVLANTNILDAGEGIPSNPWTDTNAVYDCQALAKGGLLTAPNDDDGWCYNEVTGAIWANSDLNGGPTTENNF